MSGGLFSRVLGVGVGALGVGALGWMECGVRVLGCILAMST